MLGNTTGCIIYYSVVCCEGTLCPQKHTLRVYYILLRGCLLCLFSSLAVVGHEVEQAEVKHPRFLYVVKFFHYYPCLVLGGRESGMKRADTGKTFLDFEEINSILPKELKLDAERYSRGVYRAANGSLVSISNSRTYSKGYLSWYYVYADRYAELGVNYMVFTVGLVGIILVPMDVFQSYKVGCSWKEGLNRGEKRYRIDIAKKGETYYFTNTSTRHQRRLDLTPFFIPFNNIQK